MRTLAAWSVILLSTALPAAPLDPAPSLQRADAASQPRSESDINELLREARRTRNWDALLRTWEEYGSALSSPKSWAEACLLALEARYELWDVPGLEQQLSVAQAQMDVFRSTRSTDGASFEPTFAALTTDLRLLRARLLQSRARHAEAVQLLGPAFDHARTTGHWPQTRHGGRLALDLGRSLLKLERVTEGFGVLAELVARSPNSLESAQAHALLQRAPNGLANYWGKYRDDPEHRVRMEHLRSILPDVCSRLADSTGWKASALQAFPIGVADLPPGLGHLSALTIADPRIPDFEPIVVVFAEALANDFEDPALILAHELVHARFLSTLGLRYDAWPFWAAEGLPIALSGQSEDILFETLGFMLEENPSAFLGEHPEALLRPRFQVDPFESSTMHVDSSGLAFWNLTQSRKGLQDLVRALDSGATLAAAIEGVTKLKLADFLAHAEASVLQAMLDERARSLDDLKELERARLAGFSSTLRAATQVLERDCGRLTRGYAMYLRARALAEVGPITEAIAAQRALISARREHKRLLLPAQLGLGNSFARAGRTAEARAVWNTVARNAMGGNYAELALDLLRRLPPDER